MKEKKTPMKNHFRERIIKILGTWPSWATEDNEVLKHPLFEKKDEEEAKAWYEHVKVCFLSPESFDYEDYAPYDNDYSHWFD